MNIGVLFAGRRGATQLRYVLTPNKFRFNRIIARSFSQNAQNSSPKDPQNSSPKDPPPTEDTTQKTQETEDITQKAKTNSKWYTQWFTKYRDQFTKSSSPSLVVTFLILNEALAWIGLFAVYFALDYTEVKVPFIPDSFIEAGNKFFSKVRGYVGLEPLEPGNRTAVNVATAYALVKLALPARYAFLAYITPWVAPKFSKLFQLVNVFKKKP